MIWKAIFYLLNCSISTRVGNLLFGFIRMARFLRAKEQFALLEERINFFTLLVKSYRRENHCGCFFKNSDVSNSVKEREER